MWLTFISRKDHEKVATWGSDNSNHANTSQLWAAVWNNDAQWKQYWHNNYVMSITQCQPRKDPSVQPCITVLENQWWRDLFMCDTVPIRSCNVKLKCSRSQFYTWIWIGITVLDEAFKVVLEVYCRCPDSLDLSESHHLYGISFTALTLTPKKYLWKPSGTTLRPPRGVFEAHLHLAGKPYVIATIPSQTYRIILRWPLKVALACRWA